MVYTCFFRNNQIIFYIILYYIIVYYIILYYIILYYIILYYIIKLMGIFADFIDIPKIYKHIKNVLSYLKKKSYIINVHLFNGF